MSRFQNSLFHKRLNNILISQFKISRSLQNSQNNNKKHSTFPVSNRENMSGPLALCSPLYYWERVWDPPQEFHSWTTWPPPGGRPWPCSWWWPWSGEAQLSPSSDFPPRSRWGAGAVLGGRQVCNEGWGSLEHYNQHYPHICKCFLNLQLWG